MDSRLEASHFPSYFQAVHGVTPFPWQARLLGRIAAGGGWPDVIHLPTGAGKTAAIDVALFHLALDARVAGPRIVFVTDRRTFLDQAWIRATRIQAALAAASDEVLGAVRAALLGLGSASASGLALLHGADGAGEAPAEWPKGAVVAVETVDSLAARLTGARSGDAAQLEALLEQHFGGDVVWLLDEVAGTSPLAAALGALAAKKRGADGVRFALTHLTATPRVSFGSDALALDAADLAHAPLAKRLDSPKPVVLHPDVAEGAFAAACSAAVEAYLVGGSATVGVIANQLGTARVVARKLVDDVADLADVVLVTGRMRPIDHGEIAGRIVPRVAAGIRSRKADLRPVVVVGTQCLEAGPDFDFDALVSEGASLDALRERFGRLNRMGELPGAPGVIIARPAGSEDPVYGAPGRATIAWLAAQPSLDFAVRRLPTPTDAELAELVAPPHDPASGDTQVPGVQVVWRRDLDDAMLELAAKPTGPEDEWGERARRVLRGALRAVPPLGSEMLPLPLEAARAWLQGAPEVAVTDLEGGLAPTAPATGKPKRDRYVARWRGAESDAVRASAIAAGDIIVVPTTYGGIADGSWDPTSTAPVTDRAEESAMKELGRPLLRLSTAILKPAGGVAEVPIPSATETDEAVIAAWLDRVTPRPGSWVAATIELLRAARGRWTIHHVPAVSGADMLVVSA